MIVDGDSVMSVDGRDMDVDDRSVEDDEGGIMVVMVVVESMVGVSGQDMGDDDDEDSDDVDDEDVDVDTMTVDSKQIVPDENKFKNRNQKQLC